MKRAPTKSQRRARIRKNRHRRADRRAVHAEIRAAFPHWQALVVPGFGAGSTRLQLRDYLEELPF